MSNLLTPAEFEAIRLSLLVATVAVIVSLPLGIALAWLLARREFRGKTMLETFVNLPLVLPPIVTGYLLLVTFGSKGWLGQSMHEWFGWRIVFTWKAAALASGVIAFPLMVRAMRTAFQSVDARLEESARTLGAGWFGAFTSVTLPLAKNGVIAGCVLAFARSMGEFGATIMVAGNIPGETRTIPLYIYNLIETPGGVQAAWRIVIVSIIISFIALAIGNALESRGPRAKR